VRFCDDAPTKLGRLLIAALHISSIDADKLAALAARYVAVVLPVASSVPELSIFQFRSNECCDDFHILKRVQVCVLEPLSEGGTI
jgi:hypothetical protein